MNTYKKSAIPSTVLRPLLPSPSIKWCGDSERRRHVARFALLFVAEAVASPRNGIEEAMGGNRLVSASTENDSRAFPDRRQTVHNSCGACADRLLWRGIDA